MPDLSAMRLLKLQENKIQLLLENYQIEQPSTKYISTSPLFFASTFPR